MHLPPRLHDPKSINTALLSASPESVSQSQLLNRDCVLKRGPGIKDHCKDKKEDAFVAVLSLS